MVVAIISCDIIYKIYDISLRKIILRLKKLFLRVENEAVQPEHKNRESYCNSVVTIMEMIDVNQLFRDR